MFTAAHIFVPGQGPANWMSNPQASRQALVRFRQILVDARDAVEKAIARGATEDQAVAAATIGDDAGDVDETISGGVEEAGDGDDAVGSDAAVCGGWDAMAAV